MIKLRQGTFETNSSSTHAVCVHKQKDLKFPNYIYFGLEDLTEEQEYETIQGRANYLNTIMYMCCSKTEYINRQKEIKDILKKHNVKVEWAKAKWDNAGEPQYFLYEIKDSCVNVILDVICKDETLLIDFLFGENSTIVIGYEERYDDKIEKRKNKFPEGEEYEYFNEIY